MNEIQTMSSCGKKWYQQERISWSELHLKD